jgi:hypothetical protein
MCIFARNVSVHTTGHTVNNIEINWEALDMDLLLVTK